MLIQSKFSHDGFTVVNSSQPRLSIAGFTIALLLLCISVAANLTFK
jgi:hypothetical protein